MQVTVRQAEERDVPRMFELVKELALFERAPEQVTVTLEQMREAGFGADPVWVGWVAEVVGSRESTESGGPSGLLGMAVCYERYSTWRGRCLYLEDIVVTEAARGRRIGERLFKACASYALQQGHHHMLWQVLDWNTEAMRFYVRLGATFDPKWVNGRMTREDLRRLVVGEAESGGG
ncbi:MAG TPA: GNAT family N-acetyltransferase [Flavobacteriales bacterium]|nr:GNAT family N-acetyltransferase [Flavobacteriales bacterium]